MGQKTQFGALCWKNGRLNKHILFFTLGLVVIVFALLLVLTVPLIQRYEDKRKMSKHVVSTSTKDPMPMNVFYISRDTFVTNVMNCMQTTFGAKTQAVRKSQMQQNVNASGPTGVGVIFQSSAAPDIKYEMRTTVPFRTDKVWIDDDTTLPISSSKLNPPGSLGIKSKGFYAYDVFVVAQVQMDQCIIQELTGSASPYQVELRRIPPSFLFYFVVSSEPKIKQVPKSIILTTFPAFLIGTYLIAREKKDGVKMLYHLMGAKNLTHWLSWLLFAAVTAAIFSILIAILVFIPLHANLGAVFLLIFLFVVAQFIMCFFICVLTNNVFMAIIIVIIVIQTCTEVADQLRKTPSLPFVIKIILGIFFPTLTEMFGLQSMRSGTNRVFTTNAEGDIAWGTALILLIVGGAIYFLLVIYLDPILVGDHGTPAPWTWPTRRKKDADELRMKQDRRASAIPQNNYEPPKDEATTIRAVSLTKTFKRGSTFIDAVKDVTLEIYEYNVTVVLGHNGAGKTTLINLLSGFNAPTKGRVYVNDQNISLSSSTVGTLSVCAQENIFIPKLTVKEHLTFCAKMRKVPDGPSVKTMREDVSKALGLTPHWSKKPSQLSGGYKRRLCLAMALVGDTKCVLLDEPTCGLDPEARRDVWNAILSVRSGRTIVITTQFMEEADVLGERIIIISQGSIVCYGSPSYLRKLYETGFTLTIQLERKNYAEVLAAIRRFVPAAEKKSETESVVSYSLPAADSGKLEALFNSLEARKAELGIVSLSLSVSSIEDVYIKANNYEEEDVSLIIENYVVEDAVQMTGCRLVLQKLKALLWKECFHMVKLWILIILKVLFIILFILVGIVVFGKSGSTFPELPMNLHQYGPSTARYYIAPGVPANVAPSLRSASDAQSVTLKKVNSQQGILKGATDDADKGIYDMRDNVVSMSIPNDNVYNAYFSAWGIHSAPAAISLASNTQLKRRQRSYSITTVNFPYHVILAQLYGMDTWDFWLISILGWNLWWVTFAWLHIEERATGVKHLQFMAGSTVELYWLLRFFWHLIVHAFVCAVCLGIAVLVDHFYLKLFYTKEIEFLYLAWFMGGFAAIPFIYLITFITSDVTACYIVIIVILIICNLLFILLKVTEGVVYDVIQTIVDIFLVVPTMAFEKLIMEFTEMLVQNKQCPALKGMEKDTCKTDPLQHCCQCSGTDCDVLPTYFTDAVRQCLLALTLGAILWLLLVFILDYGIADMVRNVLVQEFAKCCPQTDTKYIPKGPIDDDVAVEDGVIDLLFKKHDESEDYSGHAVKSTTDERVAMLAIRLQKRYGVHRCAVRSVSLRVRCGECYGLLGRNGAGKSTTFGMLTGAHRPSKGDAIAGRCKLKANPHLFAHQIGYCPQHDALLGRFTGRQMVQLMARLRGQHSAKGQGHADLWVNLLDVENIDRKTKTYSEGNKRKLTTALAMIGEPPILFLDEPTSGVDMWSRRKLWGVMKQIRIMGQSVVLTSHSMDECEALCDRLSIMVAGRLLCLGSVAHLKHKFRKGFTIHVRMRSPGPAVEQVRNVVLRTFPGSTVIDQHGVMIVFRLDDINAKWSFLFGQMKKLQDQYPAIDDYAISDTSLEEVFLSIGH